MAASELFSLSKSRQRAQRISGLVDGAVFSAIVIVVIATTMVDPAAALKWSLSRSQSKT